MNSRGLMGFPHGQDYRPSIAGLKSGFRHTGGSSTVVSCTEVKRTS
jgi:hypothetical protein